MPWYVTAALTVFWRDDTAHEGDPHRHIVRNYLGPGYEHSLNSLQAEDLPEEFEVESIVYYRAIVTNARAYPSDNGPAPEDHAFILVYAEGGCEFTDGESLYLCEIIMALGGNPAFFVAGGTGPGGPASGLPRWAEVIEGGSIRNTRFYRGTPWRSRRRLCLRLGEIGHGPHGLNGTYVKLPKTGSKDIPSGPFMRRIARLLKEEPFAIALDRALANL